MAKSRRSANWLTMRRQETFAFYSFMSPWIIGMVFLFAIPLVATLYLSFTKWNLLQPPQWVGLANYLRLLKPGSAFIKAMGNTAYYAVLLVPINLALSLGFAVLLNSVKFLKRFFRTAFYLPSTIPIVAVVMLWSWLLAPSGLLNQTLGLIGVQGPAWLVDPRWVKDGLIIMGVWQFGGSLVLFLSGIQGIPQMYYEAAELDGANSVQQFRHVTLPMLSPIVLFNLITGIIAALQVFAQVFIITGGHNSGATMVVPAVYQNAFEFYQMGDASTMSVVFVVVILILTMLILRWSRRWVHYEGDEA